MNKKCVLPLIAAALLITLCAVAVNAYVPVGVKEGDWIEYDVDIVVDPSTGNVSPDHNVTWARMEVTDVQGSIITLNIQTMLANGILLPDNVTLDLEAGLLGDCFIIPANLHVSNSFFDALQGTITITEESKQIVAGAQRNVISACTDETAYTWDQATGMLVNAQSVLPAYTMTTSTNKTNLWVPQNDSLENSPIPHVTPDLTVIYMLTAVAAAILIIAITVLVLRRKL